MHGFIGIDKPRGLTSAQVTNQVRRSFAPGTKAGHAGTLDPMATGVLVVAIGAATKFIRFLDGRKAYQLEVTFGVGTDTMDATGKVTSRARPPRDLQEKVGHAIGGFVGRKMQQAPLYSALKHEGRPMYHYARRDIAIEPKSREVHIESVRVLDWPDADRVVLEVSCGPGTYMRSLASDLGRAVGCGAHMSALVRTRCCGRGIGDAVGFRDGRANAKGCYDRHLVPPAEFLGHLHEVVIDADRAFKVRNGVAVSCDGEDGMVAVHCLPSPGFIGVGEMRGGCLRPLKMLAAEKA